jgi:hypothetical protein
MPYLEGILLVQLLLFLEMLHKILHELSADGVFQLRANVLRINSCSRWEQALVRGSRHW